MPNIEHPVFGPIGPIDSDDYWIDVGSRPFLFRLLVLIVWPTALVLHTAVVFIGLTATLAIVWHPEQISHSLAYLVFGFAVFFYIASGWFQYAFFSFVHMLYLAYRLAFKHGLALAAGFYAALAVAKTGRPSWHVVLAVWAVAAIAAARLSSILFHLCLDGILFKKRNPKLPSMRTLRRNPEVIRHPPR